MHAPLFCLFLPRAAGNACQLHRRLDALPIGHLAGHPGPLPVRLSGLPTHSPAGLSLLAAFLEHPLLEINAKSYRTTEGCYWEDKKQPLRCSQVCLH